MTNRERLLAIMDGRSPDRIPWIPRLQVWHTAHQRAGTLPARYRDLTLRQIERDLGMGTPARDGRVFRARQEGDVEVVTRPEGGSQVTEYRTPKGTVSVRQRHSAELDAAGIGGMEVEHLIKGPGDYAAATYLLSHTRYEAAYDDYRAYAAEIGDDGYPMVAAGDCPLHHFLQKLVGYNNAYFHLTDYRDQVEELLEVMTATDREHLWPVVADSPARLILHGVHLDSQITPPPLFQRYITPYYRELSALLHARGKTLCMHADNDSRLILRHLSEAGYDMVETFTTEPQVTCTLEQARAAWGTGMIIWGAVPSVILEPTFSNGEFEAYMRRVFRTVAPGDAFILGVADNIMPGARLERLQRIAEMVEAWGGYPIDPAAIPAV
ncbi:MAG: uroporphyrinogen decarboxylase family protein [Gemmatimonadota bacterium]